MAHALISDVDYLDNNFKCSCIVDSSGRRYQGENIIYSNMNDTIQYASFKDIILVDNIIIVVVMVVITNLLVVVAVIVFIIVAKLVVIVMVVIMIAVLMVVGVVCDRGG